MRTTGMRAWAWPTCVPPKRPRAAASPAASTPCTTWPTRACSRASHFAELDLPPHFYHWRGLEYHNHISFMKAGLVYADRISTVSPPMRRRSRAWTRAVAWMGCSGSVPHGCPGCSNGVDEAVWNPATDTHLPVRYSARDVSGKARCKAVLQQSLGPGAEARRPCCCASSAASPARKACIWCWSTARDGGGRHQFALLGSGDAGMEAAFTEFAAAHHRAVAVCASVTTNPSPTSSSPAAM